MRRIARFGSGIACLTALCTGSLWLAGCNTVEGLGEDLQGTSEKTRKLINGKDAKSDEEHPDEEQEN